MAETGDPAMDIQEELQALKHSFKNEIAKLQEKNAELEAKHAAMEAKNADLEAQHLEAEQKISELQPLKGAVADCNDEIVNLMAKNADLQGKHVDANKAISEIQDLVETNGRIIDKDENDDSISMNPNAYTFLYTSAMCSAPFIAGFVPCLMQFTVFSLFLLDLLNTTSIPPAVATLVRVCQVIAIIIAFLVETDMLTALRAVIYREGFDKMSNSFIGFAPWKFYFANVLMGMHAGSVGQICCLFPYYLCR